MGQNKEDGRIEVTRCVKFLVKIPYYFTKLPFVSKNTRKIFRKRMCKITSYVCPMCFLWKGYIQKKKSGTQHNESYGRA